MGFASWSLDLVSTTMVVWFSQSPEISAIQFSVEQSCGQVFYTLIAAQLAATGCEICKEDLTATPHGGLRCPLGEGTSLSESV